MAQAESKTAKQAEAKQAEAKTAEPKFALEKLAAHSRELFGVTASTFAGATMSLTPDEYTVAEVSETINKWKNKEAK